ncbi:MAG: efflux RND transporter periplasmic adaptor subunit [Gammaproteobacteria bacterium]
MKGRDLWAILAVILVAIALAFFILRASPPSPEDGEEPEGRGGEEEPVAKGPHGGRMLARDDFQLELTIYERGVPPQFRVYAYEQGKSLNPEEVRLTIELHRLGGKTELIYFQKESDYLRGDQVIEKPHSFDVKISAMRDGRPYQWEFSQVEGRVALSPEAVKSARIEVKTAGPAPIRTLLTLPGQIAINQYRLSHVVPRVAGVVRTVHKKLNDAVKQGEVIAVLASRELADLKGQYSTSIKILELARATFAREKRLWEEQISAEQDYLTARKELAEAEIGVETAAQRLLALGLSQADLRTISRRRGQDLAQYVLRAPFDGVVIERHMTLGEAVKDDDTVFIIADLSSVWGEITVYAKDLDVVRLGQRVTVKSSALGLTASGTVSYLGPIVGEQTRSAQARVDIPNPDGRWRPGLFVTVEVVQEEVTVPVAVAAEAIQTYRDEPVVFGQYGDVFEIRPLEVGRSDRQRVEVIKGLSAGERYAARGSFVLKAELGKAGATHDH